MRPNKGGSTQDVMEKELEVARRLAREAGAILMNSIAAKRRCSGKGTTTR
jgi:hypothetical protein